MQAGRSHQKFHYRDARFLPLKALTPLTPSARRRSTLESKSASLRAAVGSHFASHTPCLGALVTIPPRLMHSYHCLEIWAAARASWLKGSARRQMQMLLHELVHFTKHGNQSGDSQLAHNMSQFDCGGSRTPWAVSPDLPTTAMIGYVSP